MNIVYMYCPNCKEDTFHLVKKVGSIEQSFQIKITTKCAECENILNHSISKDTQKETKKVS